MANKRFNKQVPGYGFKRGGQVKAKPKLKTITGKIGKGDKVWTGKSKATWTGRYHKDGTKSYGIDPVPSTKGVRPGRKTAAYGGRINTSRENRLEELGRVDAEGARTGRGRRNLKDEKRRIVRELRKG